MGAVPTPAELRDAADDNEQRGSTDAALTLRALANLEERDPVAGSTSDD